MRGEARSTAIRAPSAPAQPSAAPRPRVRLSLLDAFELHADGAAVQLPPTAQRLVAFLALHGHPAHRTFVAGTLWIDLGEAQAHACLRTTLWRLGPRLRHVVIAQGALLSLAERVTVDLDEARTQARRLLETPSARAPADIAELSVAGDLLPDWYDDWIVVDRERFRQLRLNALEAVCLRLAREGRYAEATDAGMAAVAADPLRESAHRVLMRAHLAKGNACDALRQYESFRGRLARDLQLEPSPLMEDLVAPLRGQAVLANTHDVRSG